MHLHNSLIVQKPLNKNVKVKRNPGCVKRDYKHIKAPKLKGMIKVKSPLSLLMDLWMRPSWEEWISAYMFAAKGNKQKIIFCSSGEFEKDYY